MFCYFQCTLFLCCILFMLHIFHFAHFSCYFLLVLHFLYVTLFPCWTFSWSPSFRFSLCLSVFIFFFVLHFFHVSLVLCCTIFALFSCCIPSCYTFPALHSFPVLPFPICTFLCCTPFMLHFFHIRLFSRNILFMLISCAALLSCCSFLYCRILMLPFVYCTHFMLHFLRVALFSCCSVISKFFSEQIFCRKLRSDVLCKFCNLEILSKYLLQDSSIC